MTYASVVFDLLSVDTDLIALVKVFAHRDVPNSGIDRETFPAAYDENGFMLPFLVVRGRGDIPTNDVVDAEDQYVSVRSVVELWFHADRDAGWDILEEAADRCYVLLQYQQIAGSFNCRLVNEIDEERQPDLGDACFARRDYEVIGFKAP